MPEAASLHAFSASAVSKSPPTYLPSGTGSRSLPWPVQCSKGPNRRMPPRKNPLRLNSLQLRTLALTQILAEDPDRARRDPDSGAVTLLALPHVHGDHVHVGRYVVSARDASGFGNPAVWAALARRKLAFRDPSGRVTLTAQGLDYDTGLGERFAAPSDH